MKGKLPTNFGLLRFFHLSPTAFGSPMRLRLHLEHSLQDFVPLFIVLRGRQ
jgi:hypothetical protein